MAASPDLHPSVRERTEARVSATALAEYLILRADGQDSVLHDSRFSSSFITSRYGDAMRAIRAYCLDGQRRPEILDRAKLALAQKEAASTTTPKGREIAAGCIEAIDLFKNGENMLGVRGMRFAEARRFDELIISGTRVSVQPDLIVEAITNRGETKIGGAIIRFAKSPDPNECRLEETKKKRGDHRREMAHYMVALMEMALKEQASNLGEFDRGLCFVVDVRLGERIGPASDHNARLKAITAACSQIYRLWDTVEPRSSIRRR